MTLENYKRKRDFTKTPEPSGKVQDSREALRFVVHKHAASHLHYDLRLELDGVLKSWAIPKGPSLDSSVKRLAMMVEDHPVEYRDFEGVIPKGNYGAGNVIIWDRGTCHSYESEDPKVSEETLRNGLSKGDLKFVLHGRKLRGKFALVRIRSGEENAWLLIKKKDEYSSADEITKDDRSVVSGKRVEDVEFSAADTEKAESEREQATVIPEDAPFAPMPHKIRPMLATLIIEPFDDPEWLFEIKHDGFRAIAEIGGGKVLLYSRNILSFNRKFPAIVASLAEIKREAVFDGEIVILDEKGRSSFQLLQNFTRTGAGDLRYFVFDLLYLDGRDLRNLPLIRRKELLREVLPDLPDVRYSDHIFESGTSFFEAARENNLEGVVGKLARSRYATGRRSREWVKVKVKQRQEAIICGFTEPRGSRKYFGALVLGAYENGELVNIGNSGGGFDDATLKELYGMLLPLVRKHSPFKEAKESTRVKWVRPELVCEVAYSEWTDEGSMRMPVFLGMREGKDPESVLKEVPAAVVQESVAGETGAKTAPEKEAAVVGRRLKLTNLDKVFWPQEGYTKRDVVDYYRMVADVMLPYLRDRPESLYRTPNGIAEQGFYQKEMGEYVPEWLPTQKIYSESNEKPVKYLICQDETTLIYMANLGCIEINPWLSRIQSLDYPDYFVIDLDPEDIPFDKVVEAALAVREVLDMAGAAGFPKTSGATGMHIYVPLGARYDYDTAGSFAQIVATIAHGLAPEFTSIQRSPGKRRKKVYLDYLQNRWGQTLAAPYSIRPRPGATVSAPLGWDEVKPGLDPREFNIRTMQDRLAKRGDRFRGVLGGGIDIGRCLEELERV